MQNGTRYWIGVASNSHVKIGMKGGFAQLCHGKEKPLRRMNRNDWIIYYSSKEDLKDNKPYQMFTALGRVLDDDIYQVDLGDFKPYRRNVKYIPCPDISIHHLIPKLSFIKNRQKWGYPFRFGHFEINIEDFKIISAHMTKKGDL